MSTPRISILCPTRGRPDNVRRLIESARATATGPVEFVFYVDDDTTGSVPAFECHQMSVGVITGPRICLSEMWNRCWEMARADVGMHCGDDIVFRTHGWDQAVLEAFEAVPDRIALVHCDDGFNYGCATHSFLHRRWVDAVGYFVPPYFASDYNDLWLTEVAKKLGRKVYLPDVLTEHMHPAAGKGTWDRTHRERLARHKAEGVDQLYKDLVPKRREDVKKLRAAIKAHVLEPASG